MSGLPAANPFRPTIFRQTKAAPGAAHICSSGRPAAHSAAARNVIPPLTPFWRETRVYANNRGFDESLAFPGSPMFGWKPRPLWRPLTPFWRETRVYANNRGFDESFAFLGSRKSNVGWKPRPLWPGEAETLSLIESALRFQSAIIRVHPR